MSSSTDFEVTPSPIEGLLFVAMKAVHEDRGIVRELYRRSLFDSLQPTHGPWRQINITETRRGAIRGLHGEAMTKLISVIAGSAFGAYVDVRPDSPSRGVSVTAELHVGRAILVPKGVCNGFQATSEAPCQYLYCFDEEWSPGMAGVALNPLDSELGIDWPISVEDDDRTLISAKDAHAPSLRDVLAAQ